MLTKETTLKLCKFLIQLGEEEKNLEVVRQILAEQHEFEPYAAFTRIDRQRNGFLNVVNVREFLLNNGLVHDEQSCAYFLQHYDGNNDGKLSFEEFLQAILPHENEALRSIVTQRKTYTVEQDQLLSYDVEYALARVLDKEIQFFKKMDPYKIALKNCQDFTAKDAFYTIDLYNSQYLDFEKLGDFLIKFGYDLFQDQLMSIIKSMDKNDDGRVDLYEFVDAVEPNFELEQSNRIAKKQSPFTQADDPVTKYKNNTQTTQKYYENNYGIDNPQQIFKQFIPANQKTNLSVKKHVQNQRNKSIGGPAKKFGRAQSPPSKYTQRKVKEQEVFQKEQKNLKVLKRELGELARSLKLFISLDKEVESYKENLVCRQDFNLLDAFRLFDVDGKGICAPQEFMTVLNEIGLFPTKYELYLILKRYDSDQDGKLSYHEFKDLVRPVKKEYEAMGSERQPRDKDLYFDVSELWSIDTRKNFVTLFQIMLQNEAAVESLRQRLNKRDSFNLKNIFNFIDVDQDGFWRVSDFKSIFDQAGILIEKTDLYYLILRFDKSCNAKVSYSEFITEMAPKSTQKF